MSHQRNRDTSREKKSKSLSKQEIGGMREVGQTEDIKECIKANRKEKKYNKLTNTLQCPKNAVKEQSKEDLVA